MVYFTTFIRRLRIEKEYTQDYMALQLNMSISSYSKLERGYTDPPLSRIIKIAELLEFELSEYFMMYAQEKRGSQVKETEENSSYRFATKKELSSIRKKLEEVDHRLNRLEVK